MGVLAQCPACRTRQSVKNKVCRKCDHDLDKAKKDKRLTYWISYRLPSGKQKQEAVGTSVDEARAADGKKKAQKKEGRLFDIREDSKMTFSELAKWYLDLEKVKNKAYYPTVKFNLESFNGCNTKKLHRTKRDHFRTTIAKSPDRQPGRHTGLPLPNPSFDSRYACRGGPMCPPFCLGLPASLFCIAPVSIQFLEI